jgi:hypothetical protein
MLVAAVIVLVILGMNMLWGLAANLKSPTESQRTPAADGDSARLLLDRATTLFRVLC